MRLDLVNVFFDDLIKKIYIGHIFHALFKAILQI